MIIPMGVVTIGTGAFTGCKSLSSISIPSSTIYVENISFSNCYGLRTLDYSQAISIPTLSNTNAFTSTSDEMKIIVPNALYDTWKEATNWATYASRIVMANPSIAFKATQANSTICLNKVGNPDAISLEYLDSNGTWTPYTIGTTLTLANVDDVVYMRCPSSTTQNLGLDESNYHQFTMTGGISAEGNLTFLNNMDGSISMALVSTNAYCYYKLFSGCAALVNAPKLPTGGDYMATGAFAYMFEGCTGLTALPSNFLDLYTTIRSQNLYKGMFKGCTGLTSVELPFINLSTVQQYPATGCFDEMFMNCSSLNEIKLVGYNGNFDTDHFNDWVKGVASTGTLWYNGSDTTVGDYAIPTGWDVEKILYDGFAVEARQANSTVSIVNESSAPTLSLQYSTNEGITWGAFTVGSTTVTLANVGDRVCFRGTNTKWGGSSNNSRNRFSFTGQVAISGNINSLVSSTQYNELLDVSSGRDRLFQYLFYGNTALVDAENLVMPSTRIGGWTYCNMFENCTNLAKAPKELPATYISNSNWAYSGMFLNTAITKSPYIRITTVPSNVCAQMFDGCSSLAEITVDYTGSFGTGSFNNWVKGVAATGTFYYNGTTTTRGASYIPSGWTITTFTEPQDRSYIKVYQADMDLGIVPTTTTKVIGTFKGTAEGNWYVGISGGAYRFFNSGNTTYTDMGGGRISTAGSWDTTKWYDVEFGNMYFKTTDEDGTVVTNNGTTRSFTYSNNLFLNLYNYSYNGNYPSFYCAGVKIYDGDTLLKDFRPAVDGSNVACFYEAVSGTYAYPTHGIFAAYIKE